eukprot:gene2212-2881_t
MEMGETVPDAVSQVLNETLAMMHVLHIQAPLRFAAALADGKQVHAFRYSSDKRAPTLYLHHFETRGLLVASEPLVDDHTGWELIPQGTVVRFDAQGHHSAALAWMQGGGT